MIAIMPTPRLQRYQNRRVRESGSEKTNAAVPGASRNTSDASTMPMTRANPNGVPSSQPNGTCRIST